jgi:hypothetical protein
MCKRIILACSARANSTALSRALTFQYHHAEQE